ncbi:ASPIC/UnbV domain-containing protein [Stieleria varia]|uniref:ASPIC and UnbV n=1 Tax=Stieleria varia TaxID=2528005 RepID=A0A5C6A3H4_9BACT|nr:ASPIC/UnbV domain-containing protein [Stieleria varia]TWT93930.1 ASPIC and UnbV [Stieleria varia]
MAQFDFDNNGAIDLVINHLDRPVALLRNQTRSDGQWIQLELIGTQCERDAIGAKVLVTTNRGSLSTWMTAGDGYFVTDQPILDLGLGVGAMLQSIEVTWPTGEVQVWSNVTVNKRYLATQGQDELWERELK